MPFLPPQVALALITRNDSKTAMVNENMQRYIENENHKQTFLKCVQTSELCLKDLVLVHLVAMTYPISGISMSLLTNGLSDQHLLVSEKKPSDSSVSHQP